VKFIQNNQDYYTLSFMKWSVKDHAEEENFSINFLDKIKIVGAEKAIIDVLYLLDIDLENTPDDARLAQEVTIENPQKIRKIKL